MEALDRRRAPRRRGRCARTPARRRRARAAVSRLSRASSNDVALEAGLVGAAAADLGQVPQPPGVGRGCARGTRTRGRCRPARRRDRDGAASWSVGEHPLVSRCDRIQWSGTLPARGLVPSGAGLGSVGRAASDAARVRRARSSRGLPAPAGRRRTRRCGSCARPVAACPSTGRSAARAASSTRSSSPSWPPRSRCSRCAATASTPPSSTATSSCRPHAIGFGIDVAPGTGPVVAEPLRAAAPTSTACARSSPRPTRRYVAETGRAAGRRAATTCR